MLWNVFLKKKFGIEINQRQVDFIIPNLDRDLSLYIDPFKFYQSDDPIFHTVHTQLVKFFNLALDLVRKGKKHQARGMLSFPEVFEMRVGHTKRGHRGRGLGTERGDAVYKAIVGNPDIQKYGLRHIQELQILIPGVGYDMVSDMVANIAKDFFVFYTQVQCTLHNIPMGEGVVINHIFDFETLSWGGNRFKLPTFDEEPILLIPWYVAEKIPEINADDFYNGYYRYYLMAEELSRAFRVLGLRPKVDWRDVDDIRNKARKVGLRFSDLPKGRTVLGPKILKSKEILEKYVKDKERAKKPLKQFAELMAIDGVDTSETFFAQYKKQLQSLKPGRRDAYKYQELMVKILNELFEPNLSRPKAQHYSFDGLAIRDVTYWNDAISGFWANIKGPPHNNREVTFELKNYTGGLRAADFNQLSGYLTPTKGLLGFLVCRHEPTVREKNLAIRKLQKGEVIIILCDADILEMLKLKKNGGNPEDVLIEYYRNI